MTFHSLTLRPVVSIFDVNVPMWLLHMAYESIQVANKMSSLNECVRIMC